VFLEEIACFDVDLFAENSRRREASEWWMTLLAPIKSRLVDRTLKAMPRLPVKTVSDL
jgi:hypothetical protein